MKSRSRTCRHTPPLKAMRLLGVLAIGLIGLALACSADNLVGNPPSGPTPTVGVVFATTTPGGRVSIWLVTPTGQGDQADQSGQLSPTAAPVGSLIAPVETATAAYATLQAATATAGASPAGPLYQPAGCPAPGNPQPPIKPAQFSDYPQAIGLYLSAGGATTTLESTLRSWGAIQGPQGVVQADTDLTGDGVPEIIITLLDPAAYKSGALSPGALLIYGCAQGGYRLLFSTPYSAQTMLPELKRVGNMNGGGLAQVVYAQQICGNLSQAGQTTSSGGCTQTMQMLNWDSAIGAFTPLNDTPIDATNARIKIADVDGDGILEISLRFEPTPDPSAGPPRPYTAIWDWNGQNYVKALVQYDAPIYRIHAIYDADSAFEQGDFSGALKLYDRARDDQYLQPWLDPNEPSYLRAYAAFRKLLIYAALRQSHAVATQLTAIQTENPPGSPAQGWSDLAAAFVDAYQKTRGLHKICSATIDFLNSRSDILATINAYGYNNHVYTAPEICPF